MLQTEASNQSRAALQIPNSIFLFHYPVTNEKERRRMRASMSAASSEHPDATATLGKVKRAPSSASSTSSCNTNNNNNNSHNNNNNTISGGKAKKQQGQQTAGTRRRRWCCSRYHLNSVWSIWYCLVTLGFLAYLVLGGVKRFLAYAALPWPKGEHPIQRNTHPYISNHTPSSSHRQCNPSNSPAPVPLLPPHSPQHTP